MIYLQISGRRKPDFPDAPGTRHAGVDGIAMATFDQPTGCGHIVGQIAVGRRWSWKVDIDD